MTHQKILEKAIEKAIDNGWDYEPWSFMVKKDGEVYDSAWLPSLIFNHDFAKALWGESDSKKCTCKKMGCTCGAIFPGDYKFHLQQMVISDHPIEYLGENI